MCYNNNGDVMIKCPNCDADLEFKPGTQKVTCKYCRSTFDPKKLNTKVHKSEEVNDTYSGQSYMCSECGAELLTFDETAVTFCSYCGSQAMIESKLLKQKKPNFIIPFKKTKEECIASYKRLVNKAIFAPSYIKSDMVVNKFRGIYMPYCIYTVSHNGSCSNKGSKRSHRSGDYVYYDDYTITADAHAKYTGLSHDLISNFYDDKSSAIPFNFKESEEFNLNYLTGFYADTSDVTSEVYDSKMASIAVKDTTDRLKGRKEFTKYGCTSPKVDLHVEDRKSGMFPVYFLAIRTKDNKHVNYAIVNGQTGKAVADIPIDYKKYIILSLILAIPIYFLISSFVFTPKTVCILALIFNIIAMIVTIKQVKQLKNKDAHEDDIGYITVNKEIKKSKYKIRKYIRKNILGIIIGCIGFGNFVSDNVYYTLSGIIFVLILFSFYSLIKQHNLLVTSNLPQLEKRGGRNNEK